MLNIIIFSIRKYNLLKREFHCFEFRDSDSAHTFQNLFDSSTQNVPKFTVLYHSQQLQVPWHK